MLNTALNEAQAGIKIAGRNINNLRYADDTTLMTENEEVLKSLLIKMNKESGKSWLFLNQKQDHGILLAQLVKNLPAMQDTRVQSLGWEDPLEKGKAAQSRILAWRIP